MRTWLTEAVGAQERQSLQLRGTAARLIININYESDILTLRGNTTAINAAGCERDAELTGNGLPRT